MSKWWMHFQKVGSRAIQDPTPRDYPQLKIGTIARLRGKPNSQRRVIKTEWHRHRHEFVYIILSKPLLQMALSRIGFMSS